LYRNINDASLPRQPEYVQLRIEGGAEGEVISTWTEDLATIQAWTKSVHCTQLRRSAHKKIS
jgi:hypothetical protein